jgi:stearoyl-CoA desaturase (delta-9 desaturase)
MTNTLLFALSGLTALIAVPWYGLSQGYDLWQWLCFLLLFCYCGISITAGYHRLWSHKAYKAHPVLQWIFAIGGALALQNSALHWSSDHRRHHRHVDDNQKDPYSAGRGFWYSHIGWMLREYQRDTYHDYSNVRDLQNNPVVAFQHRHYLALALVTNIGIPLLLGLLHGDLLGMMLLAGVLRMVMTHHTTFFINSLAHIWGSQPFTDRNSARDNGIWPSSPLARAITTSITCSRTTTATAFNGGSSTHQVADPHRRLVRARQRPEILPGGTHRTGQAGDAAQARPGQSAQAG